MREKPSARWSCCEQAGNHPGVVGGPIPAERPSRFDISNRGPDPDNRRVTDIPPGTAPDETARRDDVLSKACVLRGECPSAIAGCQRSPRLVPGPARLDRRAHRPVRLRQEHAAPLPEPSERSRARLPRCGRRALPGHRSLWTGCRPGRGAHAHRPRLPAAQPVPEVDLRQRRVRPAHARVPRRHPRHR
jgi:hypothetical protein